MSLSAGPPPTRYAKPDTPTRPIAMPTGTRSSIRANSTTKPVTATASGLMGFHLAPLAGRGRRGFARRVTGPLREFELVKRPPHPDPLPASGERETRRRAESDCLAPSRGLTIQGLMPSPLFHRLQLRLAGPQVFGVENQPPGADGDQQHRRHVAGPGDGK